MTTCLAVGALVLQLANPAFTLGWTHSVEKVRWEEDWRAEAEVLVLERSRIRGSGAGMEPGEDAVLTDGWWVSPGHLSVPALHLAASGATGGSWELCADGACRDFGEEAAAPIDIAPCGKTPLPAPKAMPD